MALLAGAGCRTSDTNISRIINEPAPLPEEVRAGFGVVGVLPAGPSLEFVSQRPATPLQAAGGRTLATFATLAAATRDHDKEEDRSWADKSHNQHSSRPKDPGEELKDEAGRLLFCLGVAAAVGLVDGLLNGVPASELKKCDAALRRALQENPLQPGIQDRLRQIALEAGCSNLVSVPESALTNSPGATNRDYRMLTGLGIDSVLVVRVFNQQFCLAGGSNPPLSLAAEVDVFVIRITDNAVLHSGTLYYDSRERRFTEWAAHDAKHFRAEMKNAQQAFAESILEQLFGLSPGKPY